MVEKLNYGRSKEGAGEFVDNVGTDFISTNLTAIDNQELTDAYELIISVATNASSEKIATGIPESEIRTFIEHTQDALDPLSTNRSWLRSGAVSRRYELLLQAVAYFAEHPSFLKTFLSNEGMETVAKFYAPRKKNVTPNQSVAQSIVILVNHSLTFLEQEGLSREKGFSIIEETGLLGQFIRCVPVDPDFFRGAGICLQQCLELVKNKLKSGTRSGDILDAVIAGKDGPISEKSKSSLSCQNVPTLRED
jgi:hypothetical protein